MKLEDYIKDKRSDFDELTTSKEVDARFEDRLKSELHAKGNGKVVRLYSLSIAAGIALVLGTVLFVFMNKQADKAEKQLLLTNLSDSSTGTRLEAVYEIDEAFEKEDDQIIDVLLQTLLKDTNANVKIATVDALLKFPNNEKIRQGLVEALKTEDQPLVQLKLINSLSSLRETRAKEPLEEIINNQNSYDIVKSKAHLAMARLNP